MESQINHFIKIVAHYGSQSASIGFYSFKWKCVSRDSINNFASQL